MDTTLGDIFNFIDEATSALFTIAVDFFSVGATKIVFFDWLSLNIPELAFTAFMASVAYSSNLDERDKYDEEYNRVGEHNLKCQIERDKQNPPGFSAVRPPLVHKDLKPPSKNYLYFRYIVGYFLVLYFAPLIVYLLANSGSLPQ